VGKFWVSIFGFRLTQGTPELGQLRSAFSARGRQATQETARQANLDNLGGLRSTSPPRLGKFFELGGSSSTKRTPKLRQLFRRVQFEVQVKPETILKTGRNPKAKRVLVVIMVLVLLAGSFALFPRQSIVIGLILGGKIVAPEGSAILAHYCFGNGDTLHLSSSYLCNSPVVLRSVKNLKEGEVRRVVFKQKDDWRLSYALNPFHIKKLKGEYLVFQHIEFASDNQTFTILDLWITKFVVRDSVVHVFNCKQFIVVSRAFS